MRAAANFDRANRSRREWPARRAYFAVKSMTRFPIWRRRTKCRPTRQKPRGYIKAARLTRV